MRVVLPLCVLPNSHRTGTGRRVRSFSRCSRTASSRPFREKYRRTRSNIAGHPALSPAARGIMRGGHATPFYGRGAEMPASVLPWLAFRARERERQDTVLDCLSAASILSLHFAHEQV